MKWVFEITLSQIDSLNQLVIKHNRSNCAYDFIFLVPKQPLQAASYTTSLNSCYNQVKVHTCPNMQTTKSGRQEFI